MIVIGKADGYDDIAVAAADGYSKAVATSGDNNKIAVVVNIDDMMMNADIAVLVVTLTWCNNGDSMIGVDIDINDNICVGLEATTPC